MAFDHFVELDRRFRDISELTDSEEAAFLSYVALQSGKESGLSWNELLASPIVVVLGEPGSGKTWEFRHQVKELRRQGIPAFLVHLDRLVSVSLMQAMFSDDEAAFLRWGEGSARATFFLDSVDEAKLQKQADFSLALDNFIRGVRRFGTHRLRVVISSRISEWRVHADSHELLQRLGGLAESVETADPKVEGKPPEFRLVQLEPLDRSRVHKFAEAVGLRDPDAFVAALDTHDAWEFARRPIDVAELIAYWRERGHLGTLAELIEFALANGLRETNERIQNDPLTPEKARDGAACLGAAVVFCRRLDFLIPDAVTPSETRGAISAQDCLPADWTAAMCRAMLARAVFDVASRGRIRFHHRRVAEYLTACWLQKRMAAGCPYPILEDLLLTELDGRRIIRPSLKPVAAWLAIDSEAWNERIRRRILSCAPDLFLAQGDIQRPYLLTIDDRFFTPWPIGTRGVIDCT